MVNNNELYQNFFLQELDSANEVALGVICINCLFVPFECKTTKIMKQTILRKEIYISIH